ncbi:MAG: DUF6364 family protein [Nanoarchaeota archaeon]
MSIKTFNIEEEVYKQFSAYCKKNGISMSKRVENFLKEEVSKINNKNFKKITEKVETVKHIQHSFSKYC